MCFININLHVTLFQQCSPVSLFDSDDCVLTDVNLSDASEDNLLDFKKKFSYSSLHSDGDSYPNSPINGKFFFQKHLKTVFPQSLLSEFDENYSAPDAMSCL